MQGEYGSAGRTWLVQGEHGSAMSAGSVLLGVS